MARNVLDAEAIMTIVEQMAALRLNVLHLHLTDDEGWRLAIPGLPELTEVGARRGHDPSESAMLGPQLGSGPRPDTTGSGWLTPRDYVAILRHAAARGIEVVPEIDMPGHSRAAVVAMEARYRRLRAAGVPEQSAARHRAAWEQVPAPGVRYAGGRTELVDARVLSADRRRSSRVEVVTVAAAAGAGAAGSGAATAEPATSGAATADPAAPPPPGRPPEPARPGVRPPG